jgi:hypothetical protein
VVVAGEAPESDDELDEAEALKDNPHASDDSRSSLQLTDCAEILIS